MLRNIQLQHQKLWSFASSAKQVFVCVVLKYGVIFVYWPVLC